MRVYCNLRVARKKCAICAIGAERLSAVRFTTIWRNTSRPNSSGLIPVRTIPRGAELLEPVPPDRARGWLTIEPGWRETLALAMHPEARATLEAAIDDFRAGRVVAG